LVKTKVAKLTGRLTTLKSYIESKRSSKIKTSMSAITFAKSKACHCLMSLKHGSFNLKAKC